MLRKFFYIYSYLYRNFSFVIFNNSNLYHKATFVKQENLNKIYNNYYKIKYFFIYFYCKSLINITLLLNLILIFLRCEVLEIDFSLLIIKKLQILKNNLKKMKTI